MCAHAKSVSTNLVNEWFWLQTNERNNVIFIISATFKQSCLHENFKVFAQTTEYYNICRLCYDVSQLLAPFNTESGFGKTVCPTLVSKSAGAPCRPDSALTDPCGPHDVILTVAYLCYGVVYGCSSEVPIYICCCFRCRRSITS